MDMQTILSIDAAHGMQRKHSKLMRDLDRVRSMLPPDMAARVLVREDVPGRHGKVIRAYRLPAKALPLLFMGGVGKAAVTWAVGIMDVSVTPEEMLDKFDEQSSRYILSAYELWSDLSAELFGQSKTTAEQVHPVTARLGRGAGSLISSVGMSIEELRRHLRMLVECARMLG